jgi:hypothetical protein
VLARTVQTTLCREMTNAERSDCVSGVGGWVSPWAPRGSVMAPPQDHADQTSRRTKM